MVNEEGSIPASILDKLPDMVKNELISLSPEKREMFLQDFSKKCSNTGISMFCGYFLIGTMLTLGTGDFKLSNKMH